LLTSKPKPPKQHRDWFDYAGGLALSLTFVAASAAAIFTGRQAYLASEQLSAAREALKVSQDTEIRQLRPYLSVTMGVPTSTPIRGNGIKVQSELQLKVFGQTPAASVNPKWALEVLDSTLPDGFVFGNLSEQNESAILWPGEPLPTFSISHDISRQEVDHISAGKKRVYVFGTVFYSDSFSERRWTNFCFQSTNIKKISEVWGTCPIHNSADWTARTL
jgi:hypothetical protein